MFDELINAIDELAKIKPLQKKEVSEKQDGKWITIFPNGTKLTLKINPNTGTILSGRMKGYNIKHLPKKVKED